MQFTLVALAILCQDAGPKSWKDVFQYRCLEDIPADNDKPIFYVASVGD